MATIQKKTTTERSDSRAPQAASRAAVRTTTARTATAKPSASWEQVSHRAFEIWQQEGQPQGRDLQHWLQAESELKGQ